MFYITSTKIISKPVAKSDVWSRLWIVLRKFDVKMKRNFHLIEELVLTVILGLDEAFRILYD